MNEWMNEWMKHDNMFFICWLLGHWFIEIRLINWSINWRWSLTYLQVTNSLKLFQRNGTRNAPHLNYITSRSLRCQHPVQLFPVSWKWGIRCLQSMLCVILCWTEEEECEIMNLLHILNVSSTIPRTKVCRCVFILQWHHVELLKTLPAARRTCWQEPLKKLWQKRQLRTKVAHQC